MGEYAEMHLDGTVCESCGVFLGGEAPGHPRYCRGCESPKPRRNPQGANRTKCEQCGKVVKKSGLADHQRDVHGTELPQ